MQVLPDGWPTDSSIETAPEVFLNIVGSQWPPADGSTPEGTAEVGAWSVDRSLTGSSLPGQVRGPSGFSIAVASASFAQPAGAPLTPWGRGARRLGPGGACWLYASHTGPSAGLALGQFIVAPIRGSNTSASVSLDLEENSIRLNRPFSLEWVYDPVLPDPDASWILAKVAEQNGYRLTPAAPGGTKFSVPLVGSAEATIGNVTSVGTVNWEASEGRIGLGANSTIEGRFDASLETWTNQLGISAIVSGRGGIVVIGTLVVDIRHSEVFIRDSAGGLATFTLPATPEPLREVLVTLVRVSGNSVGVKFAERGGQWSEAVIVPTVDHIPFTLSSARVVVATTGYGGGGPAERWISGARIWEHTGGLTAPGASEVTAMIEPTGSPLSGVFDVKDRSSWSVIQEIAAATLGAAWVNEQGHLVYRNRDGLRGGTYTETVEALDSIESLDWTIDPGDVADRVELSFTPAEVFVGGDIITLWEATERFNVGPGRTTTIRIDITGTTDRVSAFLPVWDETESEVRFSRWAAATSPDGGGERPKDSALRFSAEIIGASRIQLNITNRSSERLWLVDATGNPCLIVRTSRHIAPGEEEMISSGATERSAISTLNINAGSWVQDAAAAQEILTFARSQTAKAQATVNSVRVKPNLARQLGDIIRLTDGGTNLLSKAIITGVHLAGDENGYTQHLDMGLLDPTFGDLDNTLTGLGVTTFAQLDALLKTQGINTFAQFDDWLEDLGGTL